MKKDITNLLDAVGAMSEVPKIFYQKETLRLTSDYMKAVFGGGK